MSSIHPIDISITMEAEEWSNSIINCHVMNVCAYDHLQISQSALVKWNVDGWDDDANPTHLITFHHHSFII